MKISVAMCTYNGEKYIKEQLDSILKQTVLPDEIIIQDDNSTDNTVKVIKEIIKTSHVPIKLIVNTPGLGVMNNFITAYEKCNGDIIFSCDQDDIWLSDKIEKVTKVFENNKNIDMIATDAVLIDGDGNHINYKITDLLSLEINKSSILDELLIRPCVVGATMAIKKDFVLKYLKFNNLWLHDGMLAIVAALRNSLMYMSNPTIKYRLHNSNVCGLAKFNLANDIKRSLTKPFYSEDLARKKYEQYLYIKNIINVKKIDSINISKLNDCINFWNYRKDIRKLTFCNIIKKSSENRKNNKYNLYTLNKYGRIIDVYTWFVYKFIQRKQR